MHASKQLVCITALTAEYMVISILMISYMVSTGYHCCYYFYYGCYYQVYHYDESP